MVLPLKAMALAVAVFMLTMNWVLDAQSKEIKFESKFFGDGNNSTQDIEALLFKPDGDGPFPAVVILPTCGDISEHVSEDWPDFLVDNGYAVLTVSNFHSRGFRHCLQWRNRNQRRVGIVHDAYNALKYLVNLSYVDKEHTAVMGFSEGANAINLVMFRQARWRNHVPQFKTAISFYGRCNRLDGYTKDEVPLMQIVPELDEQRANLCIRMGKTTDMDVQVLQGAYHAFDKPEITSEIEDGMGNVMLYDGEATRKSQGLVKDFLAKHMAKGR